MTFGSVYGQRTDCPEHNGAWIYDLPDQEGIALAMDGYVMAVRYAKGRKPFAGENPTLEEKAAAFDAMNIAMGKWTCDGKRGYVTYQYHKDPGISGQSFSFDYVIEGHQTTYWGIQPDGSRAAEPGHSHQVADPVTTPANNDGYPNGFWRYELPDQVGYAAIMGNYFAWIIIDKAFLADPPDLNTLEGKAAAYDAILADAGTFAYDGNSRFVWNRTFAKNTQDATLPLLSENELHGNTINYWVLDPDGKRIEPGGKNVRAE